MLRCITLAVWVGVVLTIPAGCCTRTCGDGPLRQDELSKQPERQEDLRQFGENWRTIWYNDQPPHLTPQKIKGGVL